MELDGFSRIADLYDTFVRADFDIPFFIKETSKSAGGEVLELMSGTGRVSIPLVEAGVRLVCVDKSAEMLAVLQRKLEERGLAAKTVQMDICELDLARRFDLIIIPFHSFSEIVSPEDERRALIRIHEHLSPHGRLICTLRNPVSPLLADGRLRLFSKHSLAGGQGTLLFWIAEVPNEADDHIVNLMEFFEEYDAAGILKSKRMMELCARRISKEEFQSLAESTGFKVVALYGNYDFSDFQEDRSPFMLWELERA